MMESMIFLLQLLPVLTPRQLLFERKANINLVDPNTRRTVFYTYLLDEVDNHMLEVC